MGLKAKLRDSNRYYPIIFIILFVIVLFQYSFNTLESILYDMRARWDFGIGSSEKIVLITMDEESDEFLGEKTPYTYASYDRMIQRLIADQPAIINFFVDFKQAKNEVDFRDLQSFKSRAEQFMLAGGKFQLGTKMGELGEILPPKELQSLGHSLSSLYEDNLIFSKDGVIRRAYLNASGEDSLHLWSANHFRAKQGRPNLSLNTIKGSYYVPKIDATLGLFRFYDNTIELESSITRIPFHRVVVGNFPAGFFTDKIVLIGSNYVSNSQDFVLTPFNKEEKKTPTLNVHASIIQALVLGKTVYQIPREVSYALALFFAIALSLVISKVKPTYGLMITVGSMLGICLLAYLLFCTLGLWLYLTHIVITIFVVYYIWVPLRAIGEYQRRYAIQEETKLLKKVEDLKQNFISLMSHDLKTPVAKIASLADITLNQQSLSPDVQKNLSSIIDSTKELNHFITSILDLGKLESNKIKLDLASKDVNKIIESVVESLRFEASEKNVVLEKNLAPLYPISIDVKLFQRVMSNLVENAIKYSGPNKTVSITSHDDDDWVYISVKDNGVGVSPTDLDHIFDKFYRVKNDASHSIKGTGLGLFLVKYFVELMGGTIRAESSLGSGTSFYVKLKNS